MIYVIKSAGGDVLATWPHAIEADTEQDLFRAPDAVWYDPKPSDGAYVDTLPDPVPVPAEVTMRQARLALLGAGKLGDVDTAINAMEEPTKTAARITWDYSSVVQRTNPFVLTLAGALGLDDAALDALFITAATL